MGSLHIFVIIIVVKIYCHFLIIKCDISKIIVVPRLDRYFTAVKMPVALGTLIKYVASYVLPFRADIGSCTIRHRIPWSSTLYPSPILATLAFSKFNALLLVYSIHPQLQRTSTAPKTVTSSFFMHSLASAAKYARSELLCPSACIC